MSTETTQVPAATPTAAPPMAAPVEGVTRTIRGQGQVAVPATNSDRLAAAAAAFTQAKDPPAEPVVAAAEKPVVEKPAEPAPAKPAPAEAKPATEPAAAPEKDGLADNAKRLAMVAEKERRLLARSRAEDAKIAARAAELEKREAAIKQFEELKAKAKTDPAAWLKAADLDFETAAKQFISEKQKPAATPEQIEARLRAELEAKLEAELEKKLTERQQKTQTELQTQQETQFRNNVVQQVRAMPEKYPALIAERQESEVFELMKGVFLHGAPALGFQKGTQLPFDKAAQIIENAVREDQAKRFGTHADKLKAFYESFGSPTPAANSETGKSLPASTDAGKAAEKPVSKERPVRERDGRFSKTNPSGKAKSVEAAAVSDEDDDVPFDEYRERLKKRVFNSFNGNR